MPNIWPAFIYSVWLRVSSSANGAIGWTTWGGSGGLGGERFVAPFCEFFFWQNGDYELNEANYDLIFANFLLGRTIYGPGIILFIYTPSTDQVSYYTYTHHLWTRYEYHTVHIPTIYGPGTSIILYIYPYHLRTRYEYHTVSTHVR